MKRRVTVRGVAYTVLRRERSARHAHVWVVLADVDGQEWRVLMRSARQAPAHNARLLRA